MEFSQLQTKVALDLKLVPKSNSLTESFSTQNVTITSRKIWQPIQNNQSNVYLHVLLLKQNPDTVLVNDLPNVQISQKMISTGEALYAVVGLIKFDKIPKIFRQRHLLSDFGLVPVTPLEAERLAMPKETIISYWKPEVAVKLVTDFNVYPYHLVPDPINRNVVYLKNPQARTRAAFYKPAMYADEIGLTSDKYIALNSSVSMLPLKISFEPMSLQRWLLMSHMEESIKAQTGMGFTDTDVDDVRRLISDTSVYLLGITLLASMLHLLFEFLAFQSDISFWQNNKSLAGLSTRTLITDLISQIIVFLFLIESDTSLLVTVPSFIGICIQIWKVKKATGVTVVVGRYGLPVLTFVRWHRDDTHDAIEDDAAVVTPPSQETSQTDNNSTDESSETNSAVTSTETLTTTRPLPEMTEAETALTAVTLEADRFATVYLSLLLLPLMLAFTANSLVNEKHLSWYSWAIGALTGCVYTFGFILMCPQLYINHKLKSVSHLPWKFLVFKFLNTFIDDLFAFIIKMPTMHRLSVFRDDIVFFVYIYQRWIYRIDSSRPVEK